LTLYEQCFYWNKLPKAGGILDQPYGLLDRLMKAQRVYEIIRSYNAATDKGQWMEDNPDETIVVVAYWDLREAEEHA
jgi:hypothetical protein